MNPHWTGFESAASAELGYGGVPALSAIPAASGQLSRVAGRRPLAWIRRVHDHADHSQAAGVGRYPVPSGSTRPARRSPGNQQVSEDSQLDERRRTGHGTARPRVEDESLIRLDRPLARPASSDVPACPPQGTAGSTASLAVHPRTPTIPRRAPSPHKSPGSSYARSPASRPMRDGLRPALTPARRRRDRPGAREWGRPGRAPTSREAQSGADD